MTAWDRIKSKSKYGLIGQWGDGSGLFISEVWLTIYH